ncbi:hypothetical protein DFH28DRAFT_531895 [Melampsora americana]|nr:hypothetical protein DFH28DRAFT_531895 [Melampsora americana]
MTDFSPIPIPEFLIEAQDGQFTPYDARSLAELSDTSDQSDSQLLPNTSFSSQPTPGLSPTTSVTRSRATSDALQRILTVQAQQLSAIGEEWHAKFSLGSITSSSEISKDQTKKISTLDLPSTSLSTEGLPISGIPTAASDHSTEEKEKSWMDETGCSVHSLSNHSLGFEDILEMNEFNFKGKDGLPRSDTKLTTPITQVTLEKWDQEPHHSILGHKSLVSDWLESLDSSKSQ